MHGIRRKKVVVVLAVYEVLNLPHSSLLFVIVLGAVEETADTIGLFTQVVAGMPMLVV